MQEQLRLLHQWEKRLYALMSFEQLHEQASRADKPLVVAVAGGADVSVLQALRIASDRGWVDPLLAGVEDDIRHAAEQGHVPLDGFTLLDTNTPAFAAVDEVRAGRAQLLMKGQISTPALMRAVLDQNFGLRTGRVICQVVHMELATSGRRFLLADTGIAIAPDLDQKLDILGSAVAVAHALGMPTPRVAIVSATERVSGSFPDTMDAHELQHRNQIGIVSGCSVQGPLTFDLAFDPQNAQKKRLQQRDLEPADVMLFPNLLAANLTVKAIMYTADCRFGGVLQGAACPVVFMSRADTVETRLNSLALALAVRQGPADVLQLTDGERPDGERPA